MYFYQNEKVPVIRQNQLLTKYLVARRRLFTQLRLSYSLHKIIRITLGIILNCLITMQVLRKKKIKEITKIRFTKLDLSCFCEHFRSNQAVQYNIHYNLLFQGQRKHTPFMNNNAQLSWEFLSQI